MLGTIIRSTSKYLFKAVSINFLVTSYTFKILNGIKLYIILMRSTFVALLNQGNFNIVRKKKHLFIKYYLLHLTMVDKKHLLPFLEVIISSPTTFLC